MLLYASTIIRCELEQFEHSLVDVSSRENPFRWNAWRRNAAGVERVAIDLTDTKITFKISNITVAICSALSISVARAIVWFLTSSDNQFLLLIFEVSSGD
jgi:hypothetical protein